CELSRFVVSRWMRNFEDGDSTSWRTPFETQHQFHRISGGFGHLDRDDTCRTAAQTHTNIELFFGMMTV
ncbi:MAG: hypothetical protein ABI988_16750, partial [Nitrospirota bacterium]